MWATVVYGEHDERRLTELGDRVFPAFASYRREAARSGRAVPIVELTKPPSSPPPPCGHAEFRFTGE